MVADFMLADYRKETAHVLFKAGKAHDGYFTNDDDRAMNILTNHYPDEDHVFVFDNAKTHLKHANTKFPSANWRITVIAKGSNEKIWMANAQLPNGLLQLLYFPEGHKHARWFKRMAQILVKHGYHNTPYLPAGCKYFKEIHIELIIKTTCHSCGFDVLFLPKFHCKLNSHSRMFQNSSWYVTAYKIERLLAATGLAKYMCKP
ncbi:hypothetical protein J3A83DRAFT_4358505 [Scleroderma citrinum]